jgi:hypothetical protein
MTKAPIAPALALAALARPALTAAERRTSGAYSTDFRLARYLAEGAAPRLVAGAQVIDPAAGTGILLVAASLVACGDDRRRRAAWLAESVTAWDRSAEALRGARLALASLTDDLDAVEAMVARWRAHDSLGVERAACAGYDVVLGNPPFEKLKLTRHEFLKAGGGARHYGDDYRGLDDARFIAEREDVGRYAEDLARRYPLLGRGEPDLYKAFLELFLRLARPRGCVAALVPAGLVRSQGAEALRRCLIDEAEALAFTLLDNRARFFAIDTRFKLVRVVLTKGGDEARRPELVVAHAEGRGRDVTETGSARIERAALARIRPDLTLPEVRSEAEWRLFCAMSERAIHVAPGSPWTASIVREVDMTRDRTAFTRTPAPDRMPLVEGRMVHQHRFGAKAYRRGTGRRATWASVPLGEATITPQFWYPRDRLSPSLRARTASLRAGFCDITGQTNERSMLAALIPPGVVCGNKVPTITFPGDPRESRLLLWVAIVDRLPFDWALRRLVTTTVNYFVLKSVPFPDLDPDAPRGRRVVEAARALHRMDTGEEPPDPWRAAEHRAAIDVGVLTAYGLGFDALELMLRDFPLLDRAQPPLDGEARSTVTRDLLLARAAAAFDAPRGTYEARLRAAREVGAVPYVPSATVRRSTFTP